MSIFSKNSLLAVLGLAAAVAAILVGLGFVGGSLPARPATANKPRLTGPWRYLADAPQPITAGRTAVWTGREMIVAGTNPGSDGTFVHSTEVAEAYDPEANTWRELAVPPATQSYCRRDAVWTGSEMLVWGCSLLAFDPAKNEWRRLPDPPTRHGIVAWTGHELIGWGGGCCGDVSDDGSAYDPKTNTWRKLAPAPIAGQQSPAAVWTGRELVVVNGFDPDGKLVGGAAYDPAADTWRRIPSLPQRTQRAIAVWDGKEALLVGGGSGFGGGYAFNPATNRWREIAQAALHDVPLFALWTGSRVIEFGQKTAAYDPRTDRWSVLASPPQPLRQAGAAVWTGRNVFLVNAAGRVAVMSPSGGILAELLHGGTRSMSPPLPQCC